MKNNGRLNGTEIFRSRGLNALELEIKEIGNLCSFFPDYNGNFDLQ